MENLPLEHTNALTKQLERLNKNLERQNSNKHSFTRGVITGLGTAIGATIIAGIAITFIVRIMNSIGLTELITKLQSIF